MVVAQSNYKCAIIDGPETVAAADYSDPTQHCFSVDYVVNEDAPVYFGINLHFFLDGDCDRSSVSIRSEELEKRGLTKMTTTQAVAFAEQYIDETNAAAERMSSNDQWNSVAQGTPQSNTQRVPFRLVLTGVYFHCDASLYEGWHWTQTPTKYDRTGNLNYHIGKLRNADGSAAGFGSKSGSLGLLNGPVLLHELMHNFNMNHVFYGDQCDDVWGDFDITWGHDGDGEPLVPANERFVRRCWDSSPSGYLLSEKKERKRDYCDLSYGFAEEHPCCKWENQNNNLMTSSVWASNVNYSAITVCQAETAMQFAAINHCELVLGVDGCAPAAAVIAAHYDEQDCNYAVDMRASDGDIRHRLTVFTGDQELVHDGIEVDGAADRFRIPVVTDRKRRRTYYAAPYVAGRSYRARLEVWNHCGERDEMNVDFVLPPPCPYPEVELPHTPFAVALRSIGGGKEELIIEGAEGASYSVTSTHLLTGQSNVLIDGEAATEEAVSENLGRFTIEPGMNALQVAVEDSVTTFQIVRP